MKKMILMAAVMLSSVFAMAQQPAGSLTLKPEVGMTIANITKSDLNTKIGLVAGAELEYMLTNNFSLTAGALYSMQGAKKDDYKINLEYINVPVMARFYPVSGLSLGAGVQFGFKTKGEVEIYNHSGDLKDQLKSVDISIPLGLAYEFNDFVIDARYNLGMSGIFDYDALDDYKNSVFQITLGYKFAL